MSQGYGRVGGRKRRSGGSWQWILLGFLPGLLCGVITIFAIFATGVINPFSFLPEPTPLVQEVRIEIVTTATPDPSLPTQTPIVVTATTDSENDVADGGGQVQPPPLTPIQTPIEATPVPGQPSPTQPLIQTNEPVVIATQPGQPGDPIQPNPSDTLASTQPPAVPATTDNNAVSAPIPVQLSSIITAPSDVLSGTFQMGTTTTEIIEAVNQCRGEGGACELSFGEDSYPSFEVALQPFQMEIFEVTFEQYSAFLNYLSSQGLTHLNGCLGFACIETQNEAPDTAGITYDGQNYNPAGLLGTYPVYGVTWYGAKAYCEAIGRRLPTEAEWEYAAKSGSNLNIYPWGAQWIANLAQTRNSAGDPGPVPVDSFQQGVTPSGLYNMAGNVAEWVEDWYDEQAYSRFASQSQPLQDPLNSLVNLQKTVRGGHWDARPFFARTVHRQSAAPDQSERWIGFRCVMDVVTDGSSGAAPVIQDSGNVIEPANFDNTGQPDASGEPTLAPPPTLVPVAPPPEAGGEGSP